MSVIRFVKHKDLDVDKWDNCIKSSVNSLPYAFSWYLDIVVDRWDALVLNDYEAVFPIPKKKKFGFQYTFTPFWVQQLGLFSKTCKGLNEIGEFIQAIPKEYRYVELNLNESSTLDSNCKLDVQTNANYLLILDKSYEELKKEYSKNLKRNLTKATKFTIQIFKNDSPKVLINLFRSDKGQKYNHLSNSDYNRLEHVMNVAILKHCGQVLMAYDEGNRPLAGMFLLFSSNRVVLLFTGNTNEGRQIAALPYLIDSVISEYSNSSIVFDFEGSNNKNLARFYKSFGSKNSPYQSVRINRLPLFLRMFK